MMDLRPRGDYLLLIDGSSFIHRNFHALPRLTRQSDGLQVGALYGLANTLFKLLRLNWTAIDSLPAFAAMIMDVRGTNWRHDIFPEYKAQRAPYPEDLLAQLPHIKPISEAFGLKCISQQGYEADDLIATYAKMAAREGVPCVIASTDKDLLQLVEIDHDEQVFVIAYDSLKDRGREDCAEALLGPREVFNKMGVMPNCIADFLALTGDSVDNVPGAAGIGAKTAARLLNEIGDLAAIIDAAEWDEDSSRFKTPKEMEKIRESNRNILLSRQLVALDESVPVEYSIDDLVIPQVDSFTLRGMLMDYEFMSLIEKVDRPPRR